MDTIKKITMLPVGAFSERPRVVAVHGSASTGGQWRQLVSELSSTFDVSAPDLPGYGQQRDHFASGSTTLAGDASGIERLSQQASDAIHLVAHSYGAAVATQFALDNPQRVASLTLIKPALFHLLRTGAALDMAHYTEISAIANSVRLAARFGVPGHGMARFVDYWNGVGSWRAMKPSLRAALAKQSKPVARNFKSAYVETWSASVLKGIQCPTLLIAGELSRGPAKRVAQIVFEAIPQARLTTVAGVGHMAPVTHPHLINPLIAEALAAATSHCNEASHREAA